MSYDDPIVNEVRMARELILQRFKGDLNSYFKFLRQEENKNPERLVRDKAIQPALVRQFHKTSME